MRLKHGAVNASETRFQTSKLYYANAPIMAVAVYCLNTLMTYNGSRVLTVDGNESRVLTVDDNGYILYLQ